MSLIGGDAFDPREVLEERGDVATSRITLD